MIIYITVLSVLHNNFARLAIISVTFIVTRKEGNVSDLKKKKMAGINSVPSIHRVFSHIDFERDRYQRKHLFKDHVAVKTSYKKQYIQTSHKRDFKHIAFTLLLS